MCWRPSHAAHYRMSPHTTTPCCAVSHTVSNTASSTAPHLRVGRSRCAVPRVGCGIAQLPLQPNRFPLRITQLLCEAEANGLD